MADLTVGAAAIPGVKKVLLTGGIELTSSLFERRYREKTEGSPFVDAGEALDEKWGDIGSVVYKGAFEADTIGKAYKCFLPPGMEKDDIPKEYKDYHYGGELCGNQPVSQPQRHRSYEDNVASTAWRSHAVEQTWVER